MARVSKERIVKEIQDSGKNINEEEIKNFLGELYLEHQNAHIDLEERKDLVSFRRKWSNWVLFFVGWIVIVNTIIIFLLGVGILRFSSDIVIPYFIGDSVIKTIGLAFIIVHFLFSKDSMGGRNALKRSVITREKRPFLR